MTYSPANTDGGDLIFGVEETKGGAAKAVAGAKLSGPLEAEVRRLEQMLASFVEPRLNGVRFRTFELAGGEAVILLRVPASFAAPHRAGIGPTRRFYRRNSNSKAGMDVHESREAFAASEGRTLRLVALHRETVRGAALDDSRSAVSGSPPSPASERMPVCAPPTGPQARDDGLHAADRGASGSRGRSSAPGAVLAMPGALRAGRAHEQNNGRSGSKVKRAAGRPCRICVASRIAEQLAIVENPWDFLRHERDMAQRETVRIRH